MAHASQDNQGQEKSPQGGDQEPDSRQYLGALGMSDEHNTHDQSMVVASLPEWPGECESCQDIWRLFAQPDSTHEVNLGSFEEALATQCHTHKPLVETFVEYAREYLRRSNWPNQHEETGSVFISRWREGSSVRIHDSPSHVYEPYWNLLLKKATIPHHPGTGRVLNPDWVDLDMLKKWKKTCLSTHGEKCDNPLKIWPTRPAFLIDVKDMCLVSGHVSGAFVALSYRYGRAVGATIDAATLERLQEPHSLACLEFQEYLPPIIRHAMYLTSAISERYLWADWLCVPQSDDGAKINELRMMGAIYANAVVTIIAADGDSQDGLPGLEGASEPRQIAQRTIPFGREELILRNTDKFELSSGDEYHSRAWTFQEYRMSPRKIIIKKQELHWQCQCSVWHEEMILDAEIDEYIDPRQRFILAGFPDLESLHQIIGEYNNTELRYDEDALPAVSGLLSVLSRSFTGGFLYGIPEMFFERGLGWNPRHDFTRIRRRIPSQRSVESQLFPSGLPSWSWIGWQGSVDPNGYGEASRFTEDIGHNWGVAPGRFTVNESHIEETFPITEWYMSNSPSDPPELRRRIRSTWFENRDRYKDLTRPLPPGWSRHDAPMTQRLTSEPHLYPDGCGKYIFKHADMPDTDEEMMAWYYPFPVAEIHDSTPPVTVEQSPYLFCKTWRARLWGRQASSWNFAILYNSSNREVGRLHLHSDESLALFPVTGSEAGHGLLIELVIVYKSRVYSKRWITECGWQLERAEVYTVLWIEWKDGVAYRLASGQVKTEEWENLDTESVDLVLG